MINRVPSNLSTTPSSATKRSSKGGELVNISNARGREMNGIRWFKSGVTGQHQTPCKVPEMLIDINQQDVVVIEKIADSLGINSTRAVASENFDQRDG